ncbi:protein Aster-B [Ischnura elegans]|uniref:protein Aster-B n=1 Tax=Ischnura elegans TaxID=197161 RepID=UPI001ED8B28F|nr:protein Aster-B [Ischnura elegans]
METQNEELPSSERREEMKESEEEPIHHSWDKINKGRSKDDHTTLKPRHVVKRAASEVGTHSKGESRHIPLLRATSVDVLQTVDEDKSSESETESAVNFGDEKSFSCTSPHDGRQLVNLDLNIHVHQLFTMVFTQSNFYHNFHAARKTTDIVQTPWEDDPETGGKKKKVELTVSLNKAVGPKTTRVTEKFIMLPCSKPGQLYAMDMSAYQTGFRYCDTFYCLTHFCLRDTTSNSEPKENITNLENTERSSHKDSQVSIAPMNFSSNFSVYSQIVYTKSVWSPVKAIIEKSSWVGLEEFYESLASKLKEECDNESAGAHNKADAATDDGSRKRKHAIAGPGIAEAVKEGVDHTLGPLKTSKRRKKKKGHKDTFSWTLLVITLTSFSLLNIFLCYKLKTMEGITSKTNAPSSGINLDALKTNPAALKEWLSLSMNMGNYGNGEMETWRLTLNKAMSLLDEVEFLLKNLTKSIPLEAKHRVMIASLQKPIHSGTTNDI